MIKPSNNEESKIMETNIESPESNENINVKERKWLQIKVFFVEWSLLSTYHCFPRIFRVKTSKACCNYAMQIFWLLTFLFFTAFTAAIVASCIVNYYQYSVVSTVQLIDEAPTNFPTLTLCNANGFTTKQAEDLLKNITLKLFNHDIANDTLNDAFFKTFVSTTLAKVVTTLENFDDGKRKTLGFNLSQSLLFCFFNGQFCNASDFEWIYTYEDGNCFQFNKYKPFKYVTHGNFFFLKWTF